MVSQFVSEMPGRLLGDIDFPFPEGIHAVGRLDKQSEGLLILTTNKKLTRLLFQGETLHRRTYLVKVKNVVTEEQLQQLRKGISIRVKGGGFCTTAPCEADIISTPANLGSQISAPVDYPNNRWLRITLTEGKYHQVRKMVKAIYNSVLRLVRVSIEDLELGQLPPGKVIELSEPAIAAALKIKFTP